MAKLSLWEQLLESTGLKRRLASYLSLLLEFARSVPGLSEVIAIIEQVAGGLGLLGVVHAKAESTVSKNKVVSIGAILAAVIALSHFIPALAPLIPHLQKIAALSGAVALGQRVK